MPCTISFAPTVQADGSSILAGTIAWGPSPDPMLGSYEVQWSIDGGSTWSGDAIVGGATLSHVVSPAIAATSYGARVRAISTNGIAKSVWETSSVVNSGSLVAAVPAAPAGLAAVATPGGMALSWNANAAGDAVLSYQLVREAGTVTGAPTSAAVVFGGNATSTADTTTGVSATFTYWVRATNAKGSGAWSAPVTQTSGAVTPSSSPANTIKGNDTGATAATMDLTAAQVLAMLPNVVGDTGTGGARGLVPAPAAGDAAAGKFLSAGGVYAVPAGGGGGGGGEWAQIGSPQTVSAQPAVTFTGLVGYRRYKIQFTDVTFSSTSGPDVQAQLSTDNGSSWVNTGYAWVFHYGNSAGGGQEISNNTDTSWGLVFFGVGADAGVSGVFLLYGLSNSAIYKTYESIFGGWAGGNPAQFSQESHSGGGLTTTTVCDAVQLTVQSGTISGYFTLWGSAF